MTVHVDGYVIVLEKYDSSFKKYNGEILTMYELARAF